MRYCMGNSQVLNGDFAGTAAVQIMRVRRPVAEQQTGNVFHAMENFSEIFPRYGRILSTLWKNSEESSTVWKTFQRIFHTMENFLPHCGKR